MSTASVTAQKFADQIQMVAVWVLIVIFSRNRQCFKNMKLIAPDGWFFLLEEVYAGCNVTSIWPSYLELSLDFV